MIERIYNPPRLNKNVIYYFLFASQENIYNPPRLNKNDKYILNDL